jgi:hypothetical protein
VDGGKNHRPDLSGSSLALIAALLLQGATQGVASVTAGVYIGMADHRNRSFGRWNSDEITYPLFQAVKR